MGEIAANVIGVLVIIWFAVGAAYIFGRYLVGPLLFLLVFVAMCLALGFGLFIVWYIATVGWAFGRMLVS